MFGLALLFVYVFLLSFLAFCSPCLWKLVFVLIVHLFVSYAHVNLCHFFSSSWCQGLAAMSAFGSSCLPFGTSVRSMIAVLRVEVEVARIAEGSSCFIGW